METFSALLAICAGNSPVPGEFPTQRPVTRSFDIYFDLHPNKWLSKQSWGWWFETLSCSLWRHRNERVFFKYSYRLLEHLHWPYWHYVPGCLVLQSSGYCSVCHVYSAPLKLFWLKFHDDVIKWKHFPRYWPFVREIHRSSVNFPHKGQWRGALMFTLICARINSWVNNGEAGDLRRHPGHYDVIVMALRPSDVYMRQ